MHKKNAGKLQTGSIIPKQYWLAVNGKPIRSRETAQNTVQFSDIVKSTAKQSLPAQLSTGTQQMNSSRGRSRSRTARNNTNTSNARVSQTPNMSQTESLHVPQMRQANISTNGSARSTSKNRSTENRASNATPNSQHNDTGQQSARAH